MAELENKRRCGSGGGDEGDGEGWGRFLGWWRCGSGSRSGGDEEKVKGGEELMDMMMAVSGYGCLRRTRRLRYTWQLGLSVR